MIQHLLFEEGTNEPALGWAQEGVGEASTEAGYILMETLRKHGNTQETQNWRAELDEEETI